MAVGLHGNARTTPRVWADLQASKETSGALAKGYKLSRNSVTKWRARITTEAAPMGPSPCGAENGLTQNRFVHGLLPRIVSGVMELEG